VISAISPVQKREIECITELKTSSCKTELGKIKWGTKN